MYIPILPKHIWEKADPKKIKDFDPFTEITDATTGEKKKAIIGTGPFMVTKLDKKGTTILERNPYFYGPKGEIDRMLMVKYGEKDPQLRDIKLGKLDAILSGSLKWATAEADEQGPQDLVLPGPRLLRDRLQLLHGRGRVALHRRRQGRQEEGRPGSGDPPRAVLRPEPARGAQDRAAEPGHRRQRPDLAVLRPLLPGLLHGSRRSATRTTRRRPSRSSPTAAGTARPAASARRTASRRSSSCSSARTTRTTRTPSQRYAADAKAVGIDMKPRSCPRIRSTSGSTRPARPTRTSTSRPTTRSTGAGAATTTRRHFNFDVLVCGSSWQELDVLQPGVRQARRRRAQGARLRPSALALMHDAEKIALKDAPYLITVHDNVVAVTTNDTWTGYVRSRSGPGAPFGYSWLQLQMIKKADGRRAAARTPGVIVAVAGGLVALVAIGAIVMRRREKGEPVELEQE